MVYVEPTEQIEQPGQGKQEDVVLKLTITGNRSSIMALLEQMNSLHGFSVLHGSFITRRDYDSS